MRKRCLFNQQSAIRNQQYSFYRHDPGHFRHFFAEIAFDAVLKGEIAARAAVAGAVEADLNRAVGLNIHKFDVSAISLNRRADQIDHALYSLAHWKMGFGGIHRSSSNYIASGGAKQSEAGWTGVRVWVHTRCSAK